MIKKLWKSKGVKVWFFVSVPVILLFAVIFIVASATPVIYNVFNMVMPGGGPRAIYQEGIEAIYTTEYTSKAEVHAAARDKNVELCEEGMVLLKNSEISAEEKALPLATPVSDPSVTARPKVSVFGKNSVNIAYGGSGSGGTDTTSGAFIDIYSALDQAGYDVNPTLKAFYEDTNASGPLRAGNSSDLDSGDTVVLSTAETPQSSYTDTVKQSYDDYKDMALIVITRIGGEGFDLPRLMTRTDNDGNTTDVTGARAGKDDHFLQLDQNESDMVKAVCDAGFDRVVICLNTGQAIETGFMEADTNYVQLKGYNIDPDAIDAAVWMSFPGESGTLALGGILNGSVNPSGKLADTYAVDFKADPTWANFGDNRVTARTVEDENGDKVHSPGGDEYVFDPNEVASHDIPGVYYYFVDYEESIYYGYRYYETRGAGNEEWYNENVVYPFGYGLSYTDFTWTVDADSVRNVTIDGETKYQITVTVHNDGQVAGKDVVQLYGHAPYTTGEVEKSEVVLLDFAKTPVIEPNADAEVTLTFDPYYLASYDYEGLNDIEGTGYELDGGDGYALYVAENAHDRSREIPFSVADSGISYENDPVTGNPVVNRYTDNEDAMFDSDNSPSFDKHLSRSDWEGTWPTTPTAEQKTVGYEMLDALTDTSHNNPTDFSEYAYPDSGLDNGMTLRDMLYDPDGEKNDEGEPVDYIDPDEKGRPYVSLDDDRWSALLDQCSIDELTHLVYNGAYKVEPIESIGAPRVNCSDGPVGWACFMDKTRFYETCSYCCQTVIATTWNKDLAYEFGQMVGDEGLVGAENYDQSPYSGWYAPGANIHRSPFGGRNFEYYSEDGVLSGIMAARQIQGCMDKGVFCFIKHFAVNEQETHRSVSGDSSWLTEQSMREIYLRPFEIAVKEGKTRAVMSSFNRIGTRWTGGDYRLLTEILRDEWGFEGAVLTDFNTIPAYMNTRQMAYAGGDIDLATDEHVWVDEGSTADLVVLRQCVQNVLYAVVNSNAMNGEVIGYNLPIWQIVFIVLLCVLVVGAAVWGFFVIRKALKAKDDEAQAE